MSLASTFTDIANLALKSLGQSVIENIDDNNSRSALLKNYIDEITRQVQVEIFWPELLEAVVPELLPEVFPPVDEVQPEDPQSIGTPQESFVCYQYQLPQDFLHVVELNSNKYWEIFDGVLVTTAVEPILIYKKYSNKVASWSAELVELVYKKLASEIALTTTQDMNITQAAMQRYELARNRILPLMKNRSRKTRETLRRFSYLQVRSFTRRTGGFE